MFQKLSIILTSLVSLFCTSLYLSFHEVSRAVSQPFYTLQKKQWVDSVLQNMSLDEKIGQLFMVAAYSNKNESHYQYIDQLIQKYHIGGLIFFQGDPTQQAKLTNRYQEKSHIPLMIAMDAEWGLGMRLQKTISYPKQMTLGAIQDNSLIEKMGEQIAQQCQRLGVHINFAPVIDVNSNPNNPVIGYRSFGENKEKVALKGMAYMKGLQKEHILPTGKHFPGHGDTDADSHLTLPIIRHDTLRMDSLELYPFKKLIEQNIKGMMVAHIHVPAYDNTPNRATTLSKNVVTDLLKTKLGFEGLIFTDALNMKGVSKFYPPGEVEIAALKAGNHVLLYPNDIPTAIKTIKKALHTGVLSTDLIEQNVRKILENKYWMGLHQIQPVDLTQLSKDLNKVDYQMHVKNLYAKALTLVKNQDTLIPFRNLDQHRFVSVSIGGERNSHFQKMLDNYMPFLHYSIDRQQAATPQYYQPILNQTKEGDVVVIGLFHMNNSRHSNYGIYQASIDFIRKLQLKKGVKVVVSLFGNPYAIRLLEDQPHLICAYEDHKFTQDLVPQALFGAIEFEGEIPVTASPELPEGTGIQTASMLRLKYDPFPESVHLNSDTLAKIDSIVYASIYDQQMPGCQVLVAKEGNVIYHKSFGHYTYKKQQAVYPKTLYDLASITKVAGTLQAIMYLYDQGRVDLNAKVSYYLPELSGSNKKDIVLMDILTHQAGLVSFIPHWTKTVQNKIPDNRFYNHHKSEKYPLSISNQWYGIKNLPDSLWKWTLDSPLRKKKGMQSYDYKYSDVGFYIMRRIAEKLLDQPIDVFLSTYFYRPLGATHLMYKPLEHTSKNYIAPTENDVLFRKEVIQGTVHDPGAAMAGGVEGHAGLFGNANDLAKLLQMNLQKGYYGDRRYLQSNTLSLFSQAPFEYNRRGIGWDKPVVSYISDQASGLSYGHSGFTGILAWIDPKYDLLFIFLSNRTYPDAENKKLIKEETRKKIQDVIYQAMK